MPPSAKPHDFGPFISRRAHALLLFPAIAWIVLTLKLSIGQVLVFLVVDNIAFLLVLSRVNRSLHQRLPGCAAFVPRLDPEAVGAMDLRSRCQLVENLLDYPPARIAVSLPWNLVKCAPVWLFLMALPVEGRTPLEQLLRVVPATLVVTGLVMSSLYAECLEGVTRALRDLHGRHDLSEVFRRIRREPREKEAEFFDLLAIFSTALALLGAQGAVLESWDRIGPVWAPVWLIAVGVLLAGCSSYLWAMNRREQWVELEGMLDEMSRHEMGPRARLLPRSGGPLVARCQTVLNGMVDRLASFQRDLVLWAASHEEGERQLAHAELVSLVVHDLLTPLQAASIDLDHVRRGAPGAPARTDAATAALSRATELVRTLRNYLRGQQARSDELPLADLAKALQRVLQTRPEGGRSLVVDLPDGLAGAVVQGSRLDLIHGTLRAFQALDRIASRAHADHARPIVFTAAFAAPGRLELQFGVALPGAIEQPAMLAIEWEMEQLCRMLAAGSGEVRVASAVDGRIALALALPAEMGGAA